MAKPLVEQSGEDSLLNIGDNMAASKKAMLCVTCGRANYYSSESIPVGTNLVLKCMGCHKVPSECTCDPLPEVQVF